MRVYGVVYHEYPGALPRAMGFCPFRALCCVVSHESTPGRCPGIWDFALSGRFVALYRASAPGRCPGIWDFALSGRLLRCIARVTQGYGILPFQGVLYYLKTTGHCQCPKYYALSGYSYYSFPFYIGNNTAYRNIHIIIS